MAKIKKEKFLKGVISGLFIGLVITWVGANYADELKVNLLMLNSEVVSVHAHIQSGAEVDKTLIGMANSGVKQMVLTGSPKQVIFYEEKDKGQFLQYDENNLDLLKIGMEFPDKFSVFCTIDPADTEKLNKMKYCVENGAKGLKLYSGHGEYYKQEYPLDHDSMDEIYAYLVEKNLPVIYHINLSLYKDEFDRVMKKYPNMKVILPYFGVSSIDLGRLEYFLTSYPNVYVSIGFGYEKYATEGFARISNDVPKYKEFFTKYAGKIFSGTGMVITDYEGKDADWIANMLKTYRGLLEEEKFKFFLDPDSETVYNGLNLDKTVLEQIYVKNWEKLNQ